MQFLYKGKRSEQQYNEGQADFTYMDPFYTFDSGNVLLHARDVNI